VPATLAIIAPYDKDTLVARMERARKLRIHHVEMQLNEAERRKFEALAEKRHQTSL
jgi:hypothetical protein